MANRASSILKSTLDEKIRLRTSPIFDCLFMAAVFKFIHKSPKYKPFQWNLAEHFPTIRSRWYHLINFGIHLEESIGKIPLSNKANTLKLDGVFTLNRCPSHWVSKSSAVIENVHWYSWKFAIVRETYLAIRMWNFNFLSCCLLYFSNIFIATGTTSYLIGSLTLRRHAVDGVILISY